ncbi:MAG: chorismate--pyruvate lyase [Cellvibrionaceae bacterium]|jgi:chorismate--pyruvate lyase
MLFRKTTTRRDEKVKMTVAGFPYGGSNHWRSPDRISSLPASPFRDWLLSEDSLTERLKRHGELFEVKLLGEKILQPEKGEYIASGKPEPIWIREVLLCLDGAPWVFARTLIPNTLMMDLNTGLKSLGSRPLGELLYSDRAFLLGNIELSCFDHRHKIVKLAAFLSQKTDHPLWGRRRYFNYKSQVLIVAEIFLPLAERAIANAEHLTDRA